MSEDRISRRRLLKRIGAGAAIAWSTPILTSINAPVFAESLPGCDPGQICSPCPPVQPCHDNVDCQCWMLSPDQGSACWCGLFVGFCEGACPQGQVDCSDDLRCVQTCCGQTCAPRCGSRVRSRGKPGAPRTVRA